MDAIKTLKKLYPDVRCSLNFSNPLELMVATILSAQCTDVRVNIVTKSLFARYKTASDFANETLPELEDRIRSTGFYRNKAKSIQGACERIVETYNGVVPDTMEDLITLPGVGRKTANVVLGTGFGKAVGIVVDTHVTRISKRLGLTESDNPEKIEQDLMKQFPKKSWIELSHLLIMHGRKLCTARNPKCKDCPFKTCNARTEK
ncbi:MAG: endonuclease III [Planctomycetaceae bacterium]|jgi:endonuclease-3|nr:endonuclease III [Planctomycetaceae bacterium]